MSQNHVTHHSVKELEHIVLLDLVHFLYGTISAGGYGATFYTAYA
jgi:hypothetical protein